MPGLKENTSYQNLSGAIKPMVGAAYNIGKSLPPRKSPKAVDVSRFQGVADTVQSTVPKTAPTDLKGLGKVTVPYGGSTNFEGTHPGVDIANKPGTPIPSFTGGKVIDVREGQKWTPSTPSFGNYVIVEDEQGNKHRYSHLQQSFVKVGEEVTPGKTIGSMGYTGGAYSTSGNVPSHLDYRVKDLYDKYISPYQFISS